MAQVSGVTRRPQVVCLGETMVLVTPRDPLPLVECDLVRLSIGGAESTVALYLADLGHQVAWASRVGADPLGDRVLATLAAAGIDVSLVRREAQAQTGVYFKDPSLLGTTVYYYRSGSAASLMAPEDLDVLPLNTAALVHFTGITPGLSPSCAALVKELVRRVRGSETLLSFDVNYRPAVWPVTTAAPALLELSRDVDIVFVGLDEAFALWGTRSVHDVRSLIGTSKLLVVKDGAVGATAFDGAKETFAPAHKVQVLEPVGAGDAFAAGFLSALLRREPAAACLELGHVLAKRALSSTGDFAPQDYPEVPNAVVKHAPAEPLEV